MSVLRVGFAGVLTAVVLIAGCGDSGLKCYPVRGTVLLQGRPVAEANVLLHPIAASANFPQPLAQTDAAGGFELTTLQPKDGAPAGEYIVTVELRDWVTVGEEPVRDGKNLLPAKYADPKQSPLKVQVEAKPNDGIVLELTP